MNPCKQMSVLVAVLAVVPALAANGTIPIWEPTTITETGHYVLTREITAPEDIDAIVIDSGGVVLDLNGFTITASGAAAGVRVNLPSPGVAAIEIRNGIIRGGESGIAGIVMPNFLPAVMHSLQIESTSADCINLTGGSVKILHSKLHACGGDGIHLLGPGGIAEIAHTGIFEVQGDAIDIAELDGAIIRESVANNFGLDGAEAGGVLAVDLGLAGLVVESTTLTGGGELGIGIILSGLVGPPCLVRNNSITDNGLHGVEIREGRADIRENTFAGNGGDGLLVGGEFTLIDANSLIGNGGAGIRFMTGSGHAYRNQFAKDNPDGAVVDSFGNTDGGGNIE